MGKPLILYDNRLADAALTASSTATGYAADNVADFRPYTWWQPTAMPATLTVDCGSAQAADYFMVHGHDLGTQGATLEVRGSTDNFAGSDVLVDTVTPTDDEPILRLFNSASYRYWRVRVTGSTAPSLAIVAVGERLTLPTWLPQGFDPVGRSLKGGTANLNANGQPLGRSYAYEQWRQTVSLNAIAWSWMRDTFLPAWRAHLRSSPFGFCWDADSYADEVRLVVAGDSWQAPHQAGLLADFSFEISGVVE